ncbi:MULTISPECIES: DUF2894 domain-containing protein [unclassified Paraburkholderia]|uniref:DUF2894 domain-containing protein n=1 Tax=unclassified Paraburkholderia TaxID=2615204 RepID=UPI002AB19FE2|nr:MULTISPECIES: DUF2894 domain-containing protein [unclassified Paraburkholderia]
MSDGAQNVADASTSLDAATCSAARSTLDAWRAQGANRIDPVRFATLDALERRAQAQTGAARKVLDARIETLLASYAKQIDADATIATHTQAHAQTPASNAFEALIETMSRDERDGAPATLLDYFRDVWQKVSADQQVQQSQDQVPKNAGPLNSSALVHRALFLMRDLSPGYLRQFLTYADSLAWLEDLHANAAPPAAPAPRASAAKKPRRTRAQ